MKEKDEVELACGCTDNIIHQLLRELPGAPNNVHSKHRPALVAPAWRCVSTRARRELATIEKDGTVCKFNYAYKNRDVSQSWSAPKPTRMTFKVSVLALNAVAGTARTFLRNSRAEYESFQNTQVAEEEHLHGWYRRHESGHVW